MDNTPFARFSEAEQAYALSQLDPFHDTPYRLTGAPSDQAAQSVVFTVNQEQVITAASFGLPTDPGYKWDFHTVALPIIHSNDYYACYLTDTNYITAGSSASETTTQTLYPINTMASNSGEPTYFLNTGSPDVVGVDTRLVAYKAGLTSTVNVARSIRLIGSSFEVVDESPTLYQQGSCTVYSRPSSHSTCAYHVSCVANADTVLSNVYYNGQSFSAPPHTIQEATILPDSKTWKASEGAYVVARRNVEVAPFIRPSIPNIIMFSNPFPINATQKNCYVSRDGYNQMKNQNNTLFDGTLNAIVPYNVSGAYFTGLNSEFGVYRIRTKLHYEIIPDPADDTLIVQATPTLPRNPAFERLLAETLSLLPPGVPQTHNPKGEFWKTVRKATGIAAKVATPFLTMYNPALGAVSGIASDLLLGVPHKSSAKPKPKASPKKQNNQGKVL